MSTDSEVNAIYFVNFTYPKQVVAWCTLGSFAKKKRGGVKGI